MFALYSTKFTYHYWNKKIPLVLQLVNNITRTVIIFYWYNRYKSITNIHCVNIIIIMIFFSTQFLSMTCVLFKHNLFCLFFFLPVIKVSFPSFTHFKLSLYTWCKNLINYSCLIVFIIKRRICAISQNHTVTYVYLLVNR